MPEKRPPKVSITDLAKKTANALLSDCQNVVNSLVAAKNDQSLTSQVLLTMETLQKKIDVIFEANHLEREMEPRVEFYSALFKQLYNDDKLAHPGNETIQFGANLIQQLTDITSDPYVFLDSLPPDRSEKFNQQFPAADDHAMMRAAQATSLLNYAVAGVANMSQSNLAKIYGNAKPLENMEALAPFMEGKITPNLSSILPELKQSKFNEMRYGKTQLDQSIKNAVQDYDTLVSLKASQGGVTEKDIKNLQEILNDLTFRVKQWEQQNSKNPVISAYADNLSAVFQKEIGRISESVSIRPEAKPVETKPIDKSAMKSLATGNELRAPLAPVPAVATAPETPQFESQKEAGLAPGIKAR